MPMYQKQRKRFIRFLSKLLAFILVLSVFPFFGSHTIAEPIVQGPNGVLHASFGSPVIDGRIDTVWDTAPAIVPSVFSTTTAASVVFKTLWDDNALYVLADVTDGSFDASASAIGNQDSIEIFLDELNDGGTYYKSDDLHYLVNFNNVRSSKAGDIDRFYSRTLKTTDAGAVYTGYVAEMRIALNIHPANNTQMGVELQLNQASNGVKDCSQSIFDSTGEAYRNPSLFGKLVLSGRTESDITPVDPYDLYAYLDFAKSLNRAKYVNGNALAGPVAASEAVLAKSDATQAEYDQELGHLKTAVISLKRNDKYVEPAALPKISGLPDPFTFSDGSKVGTAADWGRRSAELREMYQYYMYGRLPDKSGEVTTVVSATSSNMYIHVEAGRRQTIIPASVSLPASGTAQGPYPVIIAIESLGSSAYIQQANQRGYAVITLPASFVASDDSKRTGAYYTLYPYSQEDNDVGVLMAWAWGAGKVLDALELNAYPQIDPHKSVITGGGRYGKAALVAGAFDQRFAIVNPYASGAGGLSSFRYNFSGKTYQWATAGTAEPLECLLESEESHWFSSEFQGFKAAESLPFDQHELAALCAPRALFLSGGYELWWTNPEGMFVSYTEAGKVYDFLNAGNKIGYAYHTDSEASVRPPSDIENLLDFCDLQLRSIPTSKNFKTGRYVVDPVWDTISMPGSANTGGGTTDNNGAAGNGPTDNNVPAGGGAPPADPTPIPSPVPAVTPTPTNSTVTMQSTLNGNTGTVKLDAAKAKELFSRDTAIIVPLIAGAAAYSVALPAVSLSGAQAEGKLTLSTAKGKITISNNMLRDVAGVNGKEAGITIGQGNKADLPAEVKAAMGDKPLLQLTLTMDGRHVEWNNPDSPVIVSIPYKPTQEESENSGNIVVWYIDGSGKVVTVPNGRYDADTGMVTFNTTHFSNYAVAYVQKSFDDLASFKWAEKSVGVLAAKDILMVAGKSFRPSANITRADFLYSLVRTLGVNAKTKGNFDDIGKDTYYYDEIAIAKALGITTGSGNNKFGPDSRISRQDMMTMTERALKLTKKLGVQGSASDLSRFTDKSKVASYAVGSVASIIKEGLIVGSNNEINPAGNTTKAEAAVFLYRIYNKY